MAVKETMICEDIRWIDLLDPTEKEMESLSDEFNLNAYIVRDSMEPMHLPKFDIVENVNFLIIRFYSNQTDKKAATIQELTNKIAIFYTDKFLLTVHKFEVGFLEKIYSKSISISKCSSTEEVVIKILWSALETFDDPAQKLSEQVDLYENDLMIGKTDPSHMRALYYIKREASIAHKLLMLMQEPINHIRMIPKDNPAMQDVHDQHLKMQTLFTQVLDDVNNLMNLYMSFSSQRTNEVMKVLTIFSAFFLPLTFIVGVYGMNFHYMPELSKKWGYPAVIFLMIIVTVIIYLWFKKKRWL
jgi:magnesium transporter